LLNGNSKLAQTEESKNQWFLREQCIRQKIIHRNRSRGNHYEIIYEIILLEKQLQTLKTINPNWLERYETLNTKTSKIPLLQKFKKIEN
jgi:hypothetical protein